MIEDLEEVYHAHPSRNNADNLALKIQRIPEGGRDIVSFIGLRMNPEYSLEIR